VVGWCGEQPHAEFTPTADAGLGEHCLEVILDCPWGQEQRGGDLLAAFATQDRQRDLSLAVGQAVGAAGQARRRFARPAE
jgi:hypothetical protein